MTVKSSVINNLSTAPRSSAPPAAPPQFKPGYVDVDRLENSAGIVAIISQRARDGRITFGLHREWISDGAKVRGAFIPEHLVAQYLDMVRIVMDRIKHFRAGGTSELAPNGLPYSTRGA